MKDKKNYTKVEKVFADKSIKDTAMKLFVTASNDSGEKATFGIGQVSSTTQPDPKKTNTVLGHFDLKKDGLHFTKIVYTKVMHCALDNENGLWLWEAPPKALTRKLYYS